MTAKLELQLLGGCQIAYDDSPLTVLTLNKARALLAYLAVTNRTHTRAHLIDLLWTELPETDARRNLRVVLTKIRQAIGEQITATRTQIAFNEDAPRQVDVLTFVAAESILPNEEPWPDKLVDQLAAAFSSYRGDFLDGLEISHAPGFEEWMLLERERLRQLAFRYGEQLAIHSEMVGKDSAVIDLCRRLLEIEPWQESVHRRLMATLARMGQSTAALQQYEQCRRLLAEELAVEPEAATQTLYARIRQEVLSETEEATEQHLPVRTPDTLTPPLPSLPRPSLPLSATPFFGRTSELAQLRALIADPGCRLLTLVGPGGIGKTRLAQEVAHHFAKQQQMSAGEKKHHFVNGIFYVAATSLPTFDDLVSAVATAIGIVFTGQAPPEAQLLKQLTTKTLLLVLDNFEHLVPDADRLHAWLTDVPGLTLLVTSRERLNLSAEWLFSVQGLPLPSPTDDADGLAKNDAVQLFVRRAQRVNLGFALPLQSNAERTAVIALCRLLEGMPLALELAAAWARTHSCVEILLEIRANLDFLATDLRDIPARHRSLRAAFDHSWRLLDHADAIVLQRLVLLPAGFHATFARQITQATPAALMRLVDKSLLQRDPGGRYTMHELLRQYVILQLGEEERNEIFLHYVRTYVPWVQNLREACESADEPEALDSFSAEFENLRVIWLWILTAIALTGTQQNAEMTQFREELLDALQIYLPMITYFYLRRSRYQEGVGFFVDARTRLEVGGGYDHQLEPSVKQEDSEPKQACLLAQLTVALADIRFHLSEFQTVVQMIEEKLPVLDAYGNEQDSAYALTILGKAQIRMGQYRRAEETLQQSLSLYQAMGRYKESTAALNALGVLHSNQGHFPKAAAYYEAYLDISRENGYQRGIANALNNLGSNYARNGEYERALPLYRETYELAQIVGEELMIAVALSNLGSVARSLGNFVDSLNYYEESLTRCRAMGERRWTAAGLNGLGLTLLDSGKTDEARSHFREALTIAEEINSTPDLLDALAGLALSQGSSEPAVETIALLTFVADHAVTQTTSRQHCRELLEEIAHGFSAAVHYEAQQLAATLDLTMAVALACNPNTPMS